MEDSYVGSVQEGGSNVPTFLLKLLNMLDDESNQEFVDWSTSGTSFIVKDQVQFSKNVLPKYFKHNKFASFVRQLNMYGFRKITSLTQSGLTTEKEEVEFYHYLFIRGEENLLERIKRKVNKPEPSHPSEDVTKVLADVNRMKSYQESMNSRLTELEQENEDLWREVVNLRQKHAHQQKVVNKLFQFLVNLVHQTGRGVKRKLPLMIEDDSSGSTSYPSPPKYSKQVSVEGGEVVPLALEQSYKPTVSFPSSVLENQGQSTSSGPYITEVTPQPQQAKTAQPQQAETAQPRQGDLTGVYPEPNLFNFEDATSGVISTTVDEHSAPLKATNTRDDLTALIQAQSFESPNGQVGLQASSGLFQPTSLPSVSPPSDSQASVVNEIARYEPPRTPQLSPTDLNSHVDMVQNNLANIQDLLFNNDQVQLDYGLIQELFSTSPDIMPPADAIRANPDTSAITGNEVVLHSSSESNEKAESPLMSELPKYM